MQHDFGYQAGLKATKVMQMLPIHTKGTVELVVHAFHHLTFPSQRRRRLGQGRVLLRLDGQITR